MLAALAHPERLRLLATIADAGESGCRIDALRSNAKQEKQLRRNLGRLLQAGLVEPDGPLLASPRSTRRCAWSTTTTRCCGRSMVDFGILERDTHGTSYRLAARA